MRRPTSPRHAAASYLATGVALLALASPSLAAVPLENVAQRAHRAPAGSTLDDIRASIIQGASEAGWDLEGSSLETVRVSIAGRDRRRATVDIRFDDERYNAWVAALADRVGRRIAEPLPTRAPAPMPDTKPKPAPAPAPETGPAEGETVDSAEPNAAPMMIADELEKLDALRRRGILTEAEFQAQKAKLLSR